MTQSRQNVITNGLLLFSYFFIIIALVYLVKIPSAKGYEISIYQVYPKIFWISIVFSIFLAIYVSLTAIFFQVKRFYLGYISIFLVNILLLFLPTIRNYVTYGRADVLSHIGTIKVILSTYHIPEDLLYPLDHILFSVLAKILNIQPEYLAITVPPLFTLFYMISLYLLSFTLTKDKSSAYLVTLFGSFLAFHNESIMLAPSVQTFFLFPLYIYLVFKSTFETYNRRYLILASIFTIIMPIYHPGEWIVFSIIFFVTLELIFLIIQKKDAYRCVSLLSLLLIISWFSWFSQFYVFGVSLKKFLSPLLLGVRYGDLARIQSLADEIHIPFFELVRAILVNWGHVGIYALLSILIIIYILLQQLSIKKDKLLKIEHLKENVDVFIFSLLFMTSTGMVILQLITGILIDYNRLMRYVILFSTIVNGLGIKRIFNIYLVHSKSKSLLFLLILAVFVAFLLGIFSTFPSPHTFGMNQQVTYKEYNGVKWFLSYQDEMLSIYFTWQFNIYRFANAITPEHLPSNLDRIWYIAKPPQPPDHFLNWKFIEGYFVTGKVLKIFYSLILPENREFWRYSYEDFERFEMKQGVMKIYNNGEVWVYYLAYLGLSK